MGLQVLLLSSVASFLIGSLGMELIILANSATKFIIAEAIEQNVFTLYIVLTKLPRCMLEEANLHRYRHTIKSTA